MTCAHKRYDSHVFENDDAIQTWKTCLDCSTMFNKHVVTKLKPRQPKPKLPKRTPRKPKK